MNQREEKKVDDGSYLRVTVQQSLVLSTGFNVVDDMIAESYWHTSSVIEPHEQPKNLEIWIHLISFSIK